MDVNWNLLNRAEGNFQNALATGLQMGAQYKANRQDEERRNALTAYATNPNAPGSFEGLAKVDPGMAIQARGQQQQVQRQAHEIDIKRRAAAGDPTAMAELAGIDINAWNALGDDQRAAAKQRMETIGQAALMANSPEAWDATIERLVQSGMPEAAQYRGRFELRETALQQAGLAKQFMDMQQPNYQVVPEGGTLVNTRSPSAVAQFGAGAPPQQQSAQPTMTREQGMQAMQRAQQAGQMTSEEADILRRSLDPAQFDQYIQSRNIAITKKVDGQTYYQIGGRWFDNPEGR